MALSMLYLNCKRRDQNPVLKYYFRSSSSIYGMSASLLLPQSYLRWIFVKRLSLDVPITWFRQYLGLRLFRSLVRCVGHWCIEWTYLVSNFNRFSFLCLITTLFTVYRRRYKTRLKFVILWSQPIISCWYTFERDLLCSLLICTLAIGGWKLHVWNFIDIELSQLAVW